MVWASTSPVTSSTLASNCTAARPGVGATGCAVAGRPMMTCTTLGRPVGSAVPAPKPTDSTVIAGIGPNPAARVTASATPVGVDSSMPVSTPTTGTCRDASSRATAGGGLGRRPWAAPIEPWPIASGDTWIVSMPRSSSAAHTPTMSTMASRAPTSWSSTSSGSMPCTRPSASARARDDGQRPIAHRVGQVGRLDDPAHLTRRAMRPVLVMAVVIVVSSWPWSWSWPWSSSPATSSRRWPRWPRSRPAACARTPARSRPARARPACAITAVGSAPASTSAPSNMSPAMPAAALTYATRPPFCTSDSARSGRSDVQDGGFAHGSARAIAHAAPNPLSIPTTVTPLAHEACIANSAVTPSSDAP